MEITLDKNPQRDPMGTESRDMQPVKKEKNIRPHKRCKGRDHPDGISQLRFRFTWGGAFIWKKPPVFDRS